MAIAEVKLRGHLCYLGMLRMSDNTIITSAILIGLGLLIWLIYFLVNRKPKIRSTPAQRQAMDELMQVKKQRHL